MTDQQNSRCHKIIHLHAAAAAAIGGGLAQIPGSDCVPLSALQVNMVRTLGGVFGKNVGCADAEAILASLLTTAAGRSMSQLLVGWIPVWGNAVNASTAAGISEAAGWAAANYFDDN